MKKKNKSRSLITTMIILFLVMNFLTLFIFSFSIKMDQDQQVIENCKTSLYQIAYGKANYLSEMLFKVSNSVEYSAEWMEYFLNEEISTEFNENNYEVCDDGAIRIKDESNVDLDLKQSTLFLPSSTILNKEVIREINATEKMDGIFSKIEENESITVWHYIISNNELLRVYPFKSTDMYEPDHKQSEDTFYQMIKEKSAMDYNPVWTDPYVDYFGTGWMVTCAKKITDNGESFGYICIDVSINELNQECVKDFKLGKSGILYIINDDGDILYHPDYEMVPDKEGKVYNINILEDTDITYSKEKAITNILTGETTAEEFTEDGKRKVLAGYKIDGMDWNVFVEVYEEEFITEYNVGGSNVLKFILIAALLSFIFAVIFYYEFSQPMRDLITGTSSLSEGNYPRLSITSGFWEVNELTESFNKMSEEIETNTKNLVRQNNQINSIINTLEGQLLIIDLNGKIRTGNIEYERINDEMLNGNGNLQNLLKSYYKCQIDIKELIDAVKVSNNKVIKKFTTLGKVNLITLYPVMNEFNYPDSIVVSIMDITNNEIITNKLMQLEKMAGIGQLSAAIAHEIKNPLAAINGAVYIINNSDNGIAIDSFYNEEIETIEKAVAEAEKVTSTLLEFSRNKDNGSTLIDISNIVEQILILYKKDIIRKQIAIDKRIMLSTVSLKGTLDSVKIILQNLLGNAIDAIKNNGNISIGVYEENDIINIIVEDNGKGINEADLEMIFEPFFTTKKKEEGTGIGLWLTKTLIEDMNGDIEVSSKELEGTVFSIRLPISNLDKE